MASALKSDAIYDRSCSKPCNYILNGAVPSQNSTCGDHVGISCTVRYASGSHIDNDSALRGLGNSNISYEPDFVKSAKPIQIPSTKNVVDMDSMHTRVRRHENVLSGVRVDRFHQLPDNPQAVRNIIANEAFRGGMPSRMLKKAEFK